MAASTPRADRTVARFPVRSDGARPIRALPPGNRPRLLNQSIAGSHRRGTRTRHPPAPDPGRRVPDVSGRARFRGRPVPVRRVVPDDGRLAAGKRARWRPSGVGLGDPHTPIGGEITGAPSKSVARDVLEDARSRLVASARRISSGRSVACLAGWGRPEWGLPHRGPSGSITGGRRPRRCGPRRRRSARRSDPTGGSRPS